MKIEVDCPACSGGFIVDAEAAGTQFVCPACAVPIVVPSGAVLASEPVAPQPAAPPVAAATEPAVENIQEPEIVCPRCQLHFSPQRHRATATPTVGRKRVLIVEDMGYFRKIAEEALSDHFDVETASTVHAAQTALAQGDVDLIVLDLTLDSRNDGLSLLRGSMFKPCPVLIFTARDESEMYGEEWDELQRLGADDVLIKGMNVAESLQRKVSALLGQEVDESHVD